jgi:hypothetical protein
MTFDFTETIKYFLMRLMPLEEVVHSRVLARAQAF